jgi:hypothetical protein
MKAKPDEGGGMILTGDDKGGVAVMLWPSRFQCDVIWVLAGLPCKCIHIWTTCVMQSDLGQIFRNISIAWGVSLCNVLAANAHIWRPSSPSNNLRTRCVMVSKNSATMASGPLECLNGRQYSSIPHYLELETSISHPDGCSWFSESFFLPWSLPLSTNPL